MLPESLVFTHTHKKESGLKNHTNMDSNLQLLSLGVLEKLRYAEVSPTSAHCGGYLSTWRPRPITFTLSISIIFPQGKVQMLPLSMVCLGVKNWGKHCFTSLQP